ncbi:MAG: NUDIX domain-containing protein [Nitrospirae bacterium]|nr:NUDIX domain-containing protein [Nitrospirota bacterium]
MKSICDVRELHPWKVLKREPVFECQPWISLWRETLRLPDGRTVEDYFQLDQRDYVEIVAWQNGKVFGLWRYKHGPRRVNLGLPAGYLEEEEDALDAARRELCEEAGLISENWRYLGAFCIDGNRGPARAHLCVATDCHFVDSCASDDLEEQIGEWLTPGQWREQLGVGGVATLGAALAVYSCILGDFQEKLPWK